MFEINNLLGQALSLSDGSVLLAGATRQMMAIESLERSYQARGWVSIREATSPPPASVASGKKTRASAEGENK